MWYIGQDIVCIKTHSQNVVKEGDIFVVKGIKESCCGKIILNVGIINPNGNSIFCRTCNKKNNHEDSYWWIFHTIFKPLDELTNIDEIFEILENYVKI